MSLNPRLDRKINRQNDFSSFYIYPKIRTDLTIVPQVVEGIQTYMIKDPVNRAYQRIGGREYTLITLLNGENSFHQIQERFAESSGGMLIESQDLEDFLKYLKEADLLEKSRVERSILFYEKMRNKRKRKLSGRLGLKNILEITVPIFDPNKLFNQIIGPLRFLWSEGFLIFSFFCFFGVGAIALANWTTFKEATFSVYSLGGLSLSDFVLLYLLFFVIVGIHECAHGLTCKYHGGEVHELGFILYYFQPCFYCQVDDSYLFENKYHRIAVMTAGAYSELLLCSVAVFTWWLTPQHIFLHHLSAYVLALTGFIAVIINFNPLMKYDGYYILSDYLEIGNLREESFKYLSDWTKKTIFKFPIELVDLPPRHKKIFVAYGASALLYSGFILILFFFMGKNFLIGHYHIWGILILGALAFMMVRKRVKKLGSILKDSEWLRKLYTFPRKYPVAFGLGLMIFIYCFFFVRIGWQLNKDFIIEPEGKLVIRSLNSGVVKEVLVNEGDQVVKNQLLATIENDSLQSLALGLQSELKVTSQEIRQDYLSHQVLALKTDLKEKRRLEIDLEEVETKLKELRILAPSEGRILTLKIQEKQGIYIGPGEIICELADFSQLRARIYFPQWEIGDVKESDRVELKIPFQNSPFYGMISQLSSTTTGELSPFYEARVKIEKSAEVLKPGMTGKAKVLCGKISPVGYLYRSIFRSLRTELWK